MRFHFLSFFIFFYFISPHTPSCPFPSFTLWCCASITNKQAYAFIFHWPSLLIGDSHTRTNKLCLSLKKIKNKNEKAITACIRPFYWKIFWHLTAESADMNNKISPDRISISCFSFQALVDSLSHCHGWIVVLILLVTPAFLRMWQVNIFASETPFCKQPWQQAARWASALCGVRNRTKKNRGPL